LQINYKNFESFKYNSIINDAFVDKGNKMRLFGIVKGTNPRGELIARASGRERVKAGNRMFDKRRNQIGTVKRVFGPVRSPYVCIRPKKGVDGDDLKETEVYIDD
jgi:rRNA processing protein Gar1